MAKGNEDSKAAHVKIAVLSVVIAIALATVIYNVWPSGSKTPEVPPKDAVDTARQQIGQALEQNTGKYATVAAERSTDNSSIVLTGYVETQALMDEMNKKLKELNLSVPVKSEVIIRQKR